MLKCKFNHSIFYKKTKAGLILLVVNDDEINDDSGISSLKYFLHFHFQTKDLGLLN